MIRNSLSKLFDRHLDSLAKEIESYKNEADLWKIVPGINNSAGNLCCHLLGNLNHYIGFALGNTGYRRNRPLEFSISNVPRDELIQQIEATRRMIRESLSQIDDFGAPYPSGLFDEDGNIHFSLVKTLAHLSYHLGQINYHRRILNL